jgi:hypothetical protein
MAARSAGSRCQSPAPPITRAANVSATAQPQPSESGRNTGIANREAKETASITDWTTTRSSTTA